MKLRRVCCCLLAVLLCFGITMSTYAAPQTDTEVYIQNIINYYRCYQSDAALEIQVWIDALEEVDPLQAEAFRKIMNTWQWVDQQMDVYYDVLPEDLPEDNSLAIVVMGFALNPDGSMKQELCDRLAVAMASAQAYPEAYIICTGGGTAAESDETEAGVMARWLTEQGVDPRRIIVEDKSMSTVDNAVNSYGLLLEDYPEISCFAVITSDYHIYRSVLFFGAISDYCSTLYGTRPIPVVGNACCLTTYSGRESHTTLATGLAQMVGVDLNYQSTPALFASETPEDTAEETVASPAGPLTQEAETDEGFSLKNWFYGLFASLLNRFR